MRNEYGNKSISHPSTTIRKKADQVISFEHISVHGVNPHDNFVELSNTMGILNNMEAGIYSMVETQWDTTSSSFKKLLKTKSNKKINIITASTRFFYTEFMQ